MKNTTLCHIERDGKYLMMHRTKKQNDVNKDKWVGIGGKLEENESPEECLVREIFEETGLKVDSFLQRGIVTFVSDKWEGEYMHLFSAYSSEGEPKECSEGELRWIDKKKVYELPIWRGDKIFFKLLEDESLPFFSLKLCYEGEELISAILNGEKLDVKEINLR